MTRATRWVVVVVMFVVFVGSAAHAADWFHLGDAQFAARVPMTIENPSDADNPAVFVSVGMLKLGEMMPDASKQNVCVTDDADEIVPFQVRKMEKEHLEFVVPVKAKSTKTVYVYASKDPIKVPKFEPKTSTDIRQAYRNFENEFTAFRMEVGPGANTTGMAIDLFGKTRAGQGVQLKNIYKSEYHHRQPWGIDILKVGLGPGLGGCYIVLGDKLGRTDRYTTDFKVLYEGPVVSTVQAAGPAEVDGKKFTITRTVKCLANDRALLDQVEVKADNADDLNDVKIGLGLRDLPKQTWTEKPDAGYAFVAGDGNQAGTKKLGLGVAFDPASYVKMQEITDKNNGGHIYVLTPQNNNGTLRITDRLLAYWDGDGWINNPQQFESALEGYGKTMNSPPQIHVATDAEKR